MDENRIDRQRFDAPELAAYGQYEIGVRTLEVIDRGRVDVLKVDPDAPKPCPLPVYDRKLTLEVWYPAIAGATGEQNLRVMLRDGKQEVSIFGQARRDAKAVAQRFALVIISHGYPGNRYLLAHLAENLASKGYIVVSIEHAQSTYQNMAAFGATLVDRPLDQQFVLDQIDQLSRDKSSFLFGLVDGENAALIGYSMGGYGAIICAGGGVTQKAVDHKLGAPHGLLGIHLSGSDNHKSLFDARFKTAITFAPWGRARGFWDAQTLAGVKVPLLLIGGSMDDVSGYGDGIRAIWREIINTDRALLTFDNAGHHAGAPMPAPVEADYYNEELGMNPASHYTDAVWDSVRINNIAQHFVTAWLEKYLNNTPQAADYLDLIPNSNDGIWAKNEDGKFHANHSYWKGFGENSARGMRFERLDAGQSQPV